MVPTDGSVLYDSEEKLSQTLPRMALVASGLQALMPSSVIGTRSSVERKLPLRKSSRSAISRIGTLNASVFVQLQYAFQAVR